MTPAKQLTATGEALYGPSWKRPLADALGVDEGTVQRWASGRIKTIPDWAWDEMAKLLAANASRCMVLADRIKARRIAA